MGLDHLPVQRSSDDRRFTMALVDDHAMLREPLRALISLERPQVQIVYSGDDPVAVQRLATPPDVLLLDLNLHGLLPPADVVMDLVARGCEIIVLSAMQEQDAIRSMVSLGITMFVSKEDPHQVLFRAIDAVLEGDVVMNPQIALALCAEPAVCGPKLSEQEQRVLVLFGSGLKIQTVGRRLNISPNTVKTHLKRIRQKYVDFGRPIPTQSHVQREAFRRGYIAV